MRTKTISGIKYMALDYGLKRTGVAVTDAGGVMAFPRTTLAVSGKDAFFAVLLQLAQEEGVEAFVVGLPFRENGEESETTRQARNMAARLSRRTDKAVYLMPEYLSSWEAEERLKEAGAKGRARSAKLDAAAAVAILESFLALPVHKRCMVERTT